MAAGDVLFYRAGAVGDTLLSLFALRALRRRFPTARLLMGGYPERVLCLQDAGEVDAALNAGGEPLRHLHHRRRDEEGGEALLSLLRGLAAAVFFGADREGTIREWVEGAGLAKAVLASHLPDPEDGVHVADYMVRALRPLGIGPEVDPSPLRPSPASRREAENLLRKLGHGAERPLLALHPGSGSARKVFPPPLLAPAARWAEEELGARLLLITGPADESPRGDFLRSWRGKPPIEARGLSLPVLASLLLRARAYVGNDSGPTHLAALAGTPTVALFGPSSRPKLWRPRGRRAAVLAWEEAAGGGLGDALRTFWEETSGSASSDGA
ncbi:MAG: glycosyltransferase family 9 protein [Nitrospinota bacterium]